MSVKRLPSSREATVSALFRILSAAELGLRTARSPRARLAHHFKMALAREALRQIDEEQG
jgi:hypothetical protein